MQHSPNSFWIKPSLNKRIKDILLHIFFWTAYLFYDTISTGAILDDFGVSFGRSFLHGIIMAVMVYLNLFFLYPAYFNKSKIAAYILSSLVLVGGTFVIRTQLDLELSRLTYEEDRESRFFDPYRDILENLIEVELYPAYSFELDSLLDEKRKTRNKEDINLKIIEKKDQVMAKVLEEKPYGSTSKYAAFYLIGMLLGTAIVYSSFGTLRLVRDSYLRFEHKANYLRAENLRLRTQLNQHFLFNALGNIFHRFQSTDDKTGQEMIQNLKWMIQYAIEKCEKNEFVSLEDELVFAEKYMFFHGYLSGKVSIPKITDSYKKLGVMPMLLNPILENVIKHGNLNSPGGFLEVKVQTIGQSTLIEVINSTSKLPRSYGIPLKTGFGIGLKNLQNRLDLFYQDRAGYSFQYAKDETLHTFTVSISLPIEHLVL